MSVLTQPRTSPPRGARARLEYRDGGGEAVAEEEAAARVGLRLGELHLDAREAEQPLGVARLEEAEQLLVVRVDDDDLGVCLGPSS